MADSDDWQEVTGIAELYLNDEYILTTSVESGVLYSFRIRAKNKHGWGQVSPSVQILAASEPAQVQISTSAQLFRSTVLEWSLPDQRGAAVTEYEILV